MATEKREHWGSSIGFILAIAGSAIGLGNVWKFPYITGMNGGGAFVLIYLVAIFLLGVPIMLCEIAIGRRTGKDAFGAFKALELRRSRFAILLGAMLLVSGICLAASGDYGFAIITLLSSLLLLKFGFAAVGLWVLFAAMLILSYYSVVGGWILEYVWKSFSGGLRFDGVADAGAAFGDFIETPGRVVLWHWCFLTLAALLLLGGIRKGIERWSKILMPALFLLLLAVLVRSVTLPGAGAGIEFFLRPDFSKFSAAGMLVALGHAFYTLSLAMGITITYGSYLGKNKNIFTSVLWVVLLDTGIAIMAGLAIFPAVFAAGFDPASGPGLIFQILPTTFNHFPGGAGWFWAGLFFLMLSIAALTSAAALLESGVTFLIDQFRLRRSRAILLIYASIGLLGLLSCYSIADWKQLPWLESFLQTVFGNELIADHPNWFDLLDSFTSNWMLPLGGLMTAIFVGWIWTVRKAGRELRMGAGEMVDSNLITQLSGFAGEPRYRVSRNQGLTVMTLWGLLVRYVAPVFILTLFLKLIGVPVGF